MRVGRCMARDITSRGGSTRPESFLRDIPRETLLESLGNRGVACKAACYIILRRAVAPLHVCEARDETRPSRCILPTVRAIIAAPLFHYRASISHACVPRALIIITSYITFIFSAHAVHPV